MSENASERMATLLRGVAAPAQPGELVTHQIARAARRLGFERGRTKRLWYREARRVDADEMRRAEAYLVQRESNDEYRYLSDRIARLEAAMGVSDADFHRPQTDALRAALGRVDRPMDR